MPIPTPVTVAVVPEPAIVAMATLLLDHVPPGGLHDSTDVPGAHTLVVPVMAEGNGLTVTFTSAGADGEPPAEGVTTQLYVPALASVAPGIVIDAPVAENPSGPDHV